MNVIVFLSPALHLFSRSCRPCVLPGPCLPPLSSLILSSLISLLLSDDSQLRGLHGMHTYIRISNHDTQHNKNFQGFCELLRICMTKQDKTFSAFWCKSKVHLSSNILLWDIKKEILELTSVFTDIYTYALSSCWSQILLLLFLHKFI